MYVYAGKNFETLFCVFRKQRICNNNLNYFSSKNPLLSLLVASCNLKTCIFQFFFVSSIKVLISAFAALHQKMHSLHAMIFCILYWFLSHFVFSLMFLFCLQICRLNVKVFSIVFCSCCSLLEKHHNLQQQLAKKELCQK